MKNTLLMLTALVLFMASGCKNNAALDESTAEDLVTAYLKSNPEYETAKIDVGEIRFRSINDMILLKKYKGLKEKGLIDLTLQKQKKKFLSKDSTYFYMVSLTDQSKPYILKQDERHATVKAVNYELDEEQPISLLQSDSRIAKVTVSLKKVKNDFAVFLKNKGTASDFITKTYKVKFKKETGWILVGE
ncbi:hypothetical protein [Pedobacter frigoris]|uniref:Lipoprotein n=1 Tax=Pedobacter frigoris TaxID=2571272 RepID=A0A4U1CDL8_9SPHI|nr:hypothetical protein [Pedobacter frigoris]TKC04381.1 hypothetical protein FA047_17510 [Pedobacter frigoris]